jgi:hypothetical protein
MADPLLPSTTSAAEGAVSTGVLQPAPGPQAPAGQTPAGAAPPDGRSPDGRAAWLGDLANDPALAKFPDGPSLARAFLSNERSLRGVSDRVPVPTLGPDGRANPEQIKTWREQHYPALVRAGLLDGPPVDPGGYPLQRPQVALADGEWEAIEPGFRQTAHQLGLSPAQAQGLVGWWGTLRQAREDELDQLHHKTMDELYEQWGPSRDAFIARANAVLTDPRFDPTGEVRELVEASGLRNSAGLTRFLSAIGSALYSGHAMDFTAAARGPDRSDLEREMQTMLDDPKGAWRNKLHPDHDRARARFLELGQLLDQFFPRERRAHEIPTAPPAGFVPRKP